MHPLKLLSEYVRRRREELGLSQAALARKANLETHAIWTLEVGRVSRVRTRTLQGLASALEVPVEFLANLSRTRAAETSEINREMTIEEYPLLYRATEHAIEQLKTMLSVYDAFTNAPATPEQRNLHASERRDTEAAVSRARSLLSTIETQWMTAKGTPIDDEVAGLSMNVNDLLPEIDRAVASRKALEATHAQAVTPSVPAGDAAPSLNTIGDVAGKIERPSSPRRGQLKGRQAASSKAKESSGQLKRPKK